MRYDSLIHLLSWSSLEHLPATQQEMSFRKDFVVQMHSTSIPQLEGMASVAQERFEFVSLAFVGCVMVCG